MLAVEAPLITVGVESVQLRSGDNGVGLVQDQRGGFQIVEKAVSARVDDVFLRIVAVECVAAVLHVGRGEQVIRSVSIGGGIVDKGVAGFSEVKAFENGECVRKVAI